MIHKKNISLIAATFYGNRGAEAMLSSSIAEIQQHSNENLHFNVFSYYPLQDNTLVKNSSISIYSSTPSYLVLVLLPSAFFYKIFNFLGLSFINRLLPNSVRALANSRMLICLAGVSFVEGRTKFLPFNIATILPALLLGVPVIKFAQAMGSFGGLINRIAAKFFLSRCTHIFTRGEHTHSHLQQLLPNKKNFERADDIAFLFKPQYCLSTATGDLDNGLQQLSNKHSAGQLVVGICPSIVVAKRAQAKGWNYAQSIAELIQALTEKGYAIALYPNATRHNEAEKMHNNDLPLLDQIANLLPLEIKNRVVVFSSSLNAGQIYQIINACDVHVLSRFHAMVVALSSSIPCLVIGWSHKYTEVMERFNQQDLVIDYKQGGLDTVLKSFDLLVEERDIRSQAIINALPAVRLLSQKQVQYVSSFLNNSI
jgi:colanic acid/amylovoran biosynthesis protein